MSSVSEQALVMGPRKSLVGVVTQPDASASRRELPMFVFLNSGIVHRVGTNRMTVTLCRALAAAGYPSLRFDLSGIGDSAPRADALAPVEAALADIRETLDSLEAARKARRVILAGLCSGADFSILYAASDPRVVGLVLMDPSIPRTSRFHVHRFLSRISRARSWLNVIQGRHPVWGILKEKVALGTEQAVSVADRAEAAGPDLQSAEVRQVLEQAYGGAIDNGLQICAIFTAGLEDRHNYRDQLRDAFPQVAFGDQLRLEYFHDSDHMFTSEAARERLVDLVADWACGTVFPLEGQPRSSRIEA